MSFLKNRKLIIYIRTISLIECLFFIFSGISYSVPPNNAILRAPITEGQSGRILSALEIEEDILAVKMYARHCQSISEEGLRARTRELMKRIKAGERLSNIVIECFGMVYEAARRNEYVNESAYDSQLRAVMDSYMGGKAIEMKNGEGKSLVGIFLIFLRALKGKGVHICTFNDFNARQYIQRYGHILHMLGLSVGLVEEVKAAFRFDPRTRGQKYKFFRKVSRKEAYLCDVTFGAVNCFKGDYLRDQRVKSDRNKVQRRYKPGMVLVDDGVSALVEETSSFKVTMPKRKTETGVNYAAIYNLVSRRLQKDIHYTFDKANGAIEINGTGKKEIRQLKRKIKVFCFNSQFTASFFIGRVLFVKELLKNYFVENGRIVIVDELTGRRKRGYAYSLCTQELLEAKEKLTIGRPLAIAGQISNCNYFKRAEVLITMDADINEKAKHILRYKYELDTIRIPERVPSKRKDEVVFYKTEKQMRKALSMDTCDYISDRGAPVLIATRGFRDTESSKGQSIDCQIESEAVNRQLDPKILVLDPVNDSGEDTKIEIAGHDNVVLLSSMSGIGTEITLRGKKAKMYGVHIKIIGIPKTTRRLNQLRGRVARNEAPGSSKWYIPLDDELIEIFATEEEKLYIEEVKRKTEDFRPIKDIKLQDIVAEIQRRSEMRIYSDFDKMMEYDTALHPLRSPYYALREFLLDIKYSDVRARRLFDRLDITWERFLSKFEELEVSVFNPDVFKHRSYGLFRNIITYNLKGMDDIIDTIKPKLLEVDETYPDLSQSLVIRKDIEIPDTPNLDLRDMELRYFIIAMIISKGNRTKAGDMLGITARTVGNKINELLGYQPSVFFKKKASLERLTGMDFLIGYLMRDINISFDSILEPEISDAKFSSRIQTTDL